MIGLGKTSVSTLLGNALNSPVFYESVDDNPILPLFYSETVDTVQANRYPFLLQLWFLNSRFDSIKKASHHPCSILDRSIYEDWYFAKVNKDLGKISDLEFQIYEDLLHNMLGEIDGLPKKAPDLMIYLKGSFETVIKRINLRGRDYEQDAALIDYYKKLWEGYDDWLYYHYQASDALVIDMDQIDIINNPEDAQHLIKTVNAKLRAIKNNDD
ncbi:deoxynucleoside kinase [Terrilactibacillus sp. BCM23-1]|uniref:Deoxynucleoside kinase n=2 Tax=Terrilactibacillus tamarindi TaxID=2599694 RepID=A0A6N8CLS9_9BACI|nr:deoxynucleoside kinase [Terrilactibacillus tamarindi]